MKHRENIFFLIVGLVISTVAISGVVTTHEVYRLTNNIPLFYFWTALCILFQAPILLIPLDRGRTLGFLNSVFPQWVSQLLVGWNIAQILNLILFPVFVLLPAGKHFYDYAPAFVAGGVYFIVFRSASQVVERQVTMQLDNLPKHWEPLTILHLSDVHSGPFMRPNHLRKIVGRLNQREFDLCVITGDVVNHSSRELPWTIDLLEKLNAPLGIFAAMGNHEYIDDEKTVIAGYEKSKIQLLLDSSKLVENGRHRVRLIGVDYPFEKGVTGEEEIQKALAKSLEKAPAQDDELKILLSHHPNGFKVAQTMGIPITLAGHTHGGQIQIGNKSLIGNFAQYIKGLYQDGDSFLYVNSGLGNWMPFRINVPCEYALIRVESRRSTTTPMNN